MLSDGAASVAVLSLGCITQDWRMPVNGIETPVVLGYARPQDYRANRYAMGVIAGRVANRIAGARFELDGEVFLLPANEPPNHLHGGRGGLHARNWAMEADGNRALRLSLVSEHLDQGYPGRLELEITMSLNRDRLRYDMTARSDRPTPVNLAQHSYYTLGADTVRGFDLTLPADRYTPNRSDGIPLGHEEGVGGAPFDFRAGRRIAQADPPGQGIDANFVLSGGPVVLRGNGMRLELDTDQPCLQLYSGHKLAPGAAPLPGQRHAPFSGLCLEPQGYPNAVNTPAFPCPLTTPDAPYRQTISVRICRDSP